MKGSIPGMLSLVKAVEITYIRLEFIENGTLSDMEKKPLGVRFVELYGCPLEAGPLAECGTHWTRVSTNSSAYRHIGYFPKSRGKLIYISTFVWYLFSYDYNLKIFYFCDISPKSNTMQCYKYMADSRKVK